MKKDKKVGNSKAIKRLIILFVLITSFFVLILLYGHYIETKKLIVKEYRIISDSFSGNLHGYKIVQIADIHYGKTTDKKDLDKIVRKINKTKPDILIFNGDLIDKNTELTDKLVEEIELSLSKLNGEILKYAISGDSDLNDKYGLILENTGFMLLDNHYEKLYVNQNEYIFIAGIKTKADGVDIDEKIKEIKEEEESENKPLYSILLIHEPEIVDDIDIKVDLMFAAHTHKGQIIIPFVGGILYPNDSKKYRGTYHEVRNIPLYITSGIGTTKNGFRLNNPPSFNLYRMVSY